MIWIETRNSIRDYDEIDDYICQNFIENKIGIESFFSIFY